MISNAGVISTESEVGACRKLWERFSPRQEAWDDWDLMFAFHDQERHRLNFLVLRTADGQPEGLLPLVHDTDKDRFTLMAGSYPDGRVLWLRYCDFAKFFEQVPEKTVLFDLKKSWVTRLLEFDRRFDVNFSEPELRYYLVPSEFDYDFHRHLDTFPSEKKQKFLYDLRHIRRRAPTLRWSEDNEADLFIELVNRNFGANSDYADDRDADEVRRVISALKRSGRLKTLTIDNRWHQASRGLIDSPRQQNGSALRGQQQRLQ